MKSPVKQKPSTLQQAINNAMSGGGGGGGTQVQANWTETNTSDPSYIKNKPDLSDMATKTWVGNQGYITDANEVPEPTSEQDNYVLTADYGETPSYSWQPASGGSFTQVQANWNETDDTDPSYIQNKPTIPAAQVNSDWNAVSGVTQILNKPDLSGYATTTDISDMATETWVGNQGYLTSAREVPEVTLASQDGKVLTASYSGGVGSYDWETPPSGLAVETDGTNYWITVNSIRLYFASSAPTGTIPNGSLGIGW